MRFVWAVAAFLLAAVLIGFGMAQRTVLLGATTAEAEVTASEELPFTLVDGAVLNNLPGPQSLSTDGTGPVFAAYGRTADVEAWLSDTAYNRVSVNEDGEVVASVVEPSVPDPAAEEPATDDASADEGAVDEGAADEGATTDDTVEATVPGRDPRGSDLWLEQYTQEDGLVLRLQLPETMSVLIATDGTTPAPSTVTVSWPIDNATPWAGPLLIGGAVMLVLGIILYVLGIRHVRRSRGPRRKGLPVAATEPIDTIEAEEAKGVISSGGPARRPSGRRSLTGRRSFVAVPVLLVGALALSGCSPEAWPQFGSTPTPTPTPTVMSAETVQAPAITESQARRILTQVSDVVAQADETLDADLAATRLTDAALDVRRANYTIRGQAGDYPALPPIPTSPLEIVLPESNDGWPRTVMAVVGDPDDTEVAPSLIVLTQTDPWTDYRLSYLASMAASAELPDVAPASIGATRVPPESSFLMIAPQDLAAAYSDVLDNGPDSEYAVMFDETSDRFRQKVSDDRRTRLDAFNETGAETGSLTFSTAPGPFDPIALATLEAGAIVAVSVVDTDTVEATNPDAVIKLDGNQTVQALSGATQSERGFRTNFSDQLFFYVPSQTAGGRIQLLGFNSNVVSAGVIE